jgi:hypothetical protein
VARKGYGPRPSAAKPLAVRQSEQKALAASRKAARKAQAKPGRNALDHPFQTGTCVVCTEEILEPRTGKKGEGQWIHKTLYPVTIAVHGAYPR